MHKFTLVGFTMLTLACVACEKREEKPPVDNTPVGEPQVQRPTQDNPVVTEPATGPVSAVRSTNAAAVDRITEARCKREQRCENVGADKKYSSQVACDKQTRADWKEDLNAYDCAGGIVEKELDECLKAIGEEDCNNPLDKLTSLVACRSSDICKAVE